MSDTTRCIKDALANALIKSEAKGDLVIATSVINNVTEPMAEAVKSVYAGISHTSRVGSLKQSCVTGNI